MADLEGNLNAKNFHTETPTPDYGFHVKGASHLDFGMKRRLSRIFQADGRTVMLAFDHGYFQGPTRGLERVDLNIVPLAPWADALMGPRGIFRSSFPADGNMPLVVRASGGPSILRELSDEHVALDMADAVRKATELATAGQAVVLSPACSSYDMYKNFGERGMAFRAAVDGLSR